MKPSDTYFASREAEIRAEHESRLMQMAKTIDEVLDGQDGWDDATRAQMAEAMLQVCADGIRGEITRWRAELGMEAKP